MSDRTINATPYYWSFEEDAKRQSAAPREMDELVAAVIVNAADQGKSIKRILRLMAASAPPQRLVGFGFAAWEGPTGAPAYRYIAIHSLAAAGPTFKSEIRLDLEIEPCIEMVRHTVDFYENSLDAEFGLFRLLDLQCMLGQTVDQVSRSIRRMSLRLISSPDIPRLEVLSSPSQDDWLAKSAELYRSGKREESLDIIFDSIDDMLLESKFEDCDKILAEISVAELANPQLLTVLTATAPAKERLPSRQALVKRVKLTLNERGGNASRLLAGLE